MLLVPCPSPHWQFSHYSVNLAKKPRRPCLPRPRLTPTVPPQPRFLATVTLLPVNPDGSSQQPRKLKYHVHESRSRPGRLRKSTISEEGKHYNLGRRIPPAFHESTRASSGDRPAHKCSTRNVKQPRTRKWEETSQNADAEALRRHQ